MNELFLHVGYHKTGTTFLQRNIFEKSNLINYLGVPWINDNIGQFFREFKLVNDLDFNAALFKRQFRHLINNSGIENKKKPVLVSLESLHSGPEWFGLHVKSMVNRLYDVFHPSKIIIGIRNQKDYINSNYKEYLIHGGKLSFKYFLYHSFAFNRCLKPKLAYDEIIKLYRQKFGAEYVFIYLQEQLKSDPELILQKMSDFLKIDRFPISNETRYASMSQISSQVVRILNRLLSKDFVEQYYYVGEPEKWTLKEQGRRNIVRVVKKLDKILLSNFFKSSFLNKADETYIDDLFSGSNEILNELLDSDIQKYGYVY